ncbi:hypothetical protein DL546_005084 [Coniochaeta pulveracea]|uniref:Uncharacterized protein n=1 Tax=Coniochaeta pulveracea TaxID=177199 RepID=A0A420Y640_9PEZI|nr:hypothetical protein DL546_005084 [Coniochaeta pulveracea]
MLSSVSNKSFPKGGTAGTIPVMLNYVVENAALPTSTSAAPTAATPALRTVLDGLEANTNRGVCEVHNACQATNQRCTNQALDSSPYCRRHQCSVPDCPNEGHQLPGHQNLCTTHRCHHTTPPCPNRATDNSDFCPRHKCSSPSCHQAALLPDPSPTLPSFCAQHKCSIPPCSNPSLPSSSFCQDHTCSLPACHNSLRPGTRFCDVHGCRHQHDHNAPCTHPSSPGSQFCHEHTCSLDACANEADHPLNHRFCHAHTCRHPRCLNQAVDEGSFCKRHECGEEDCHDEAVAKGRCGEHNSGIGRGARIGRLGLLGLGLGGGGLLLGGGGGGGGTGLLGGPGLDGGVLGLGAVPALMNRREREYGRFGSDYGIGRRRYGL